MDFVFAVDLSFNFKVVKIASLDVKSVDRSDGLLENTCL